MGLIFINKGKLNWGLISVLILFVGLIIPINQSLIGQENNAINPTFVGQIGSGDAVDINTDLLYPEGVVITNNQIYVKDGIIKVFDMSGNYVQNFGSEGVAEGELGPSHGIASNNTHLFVTKRSHSVNMVSSGDLVQIFDLEGNFVKEFGESGAGDGQFSTPQGVAVDTSNIFVADTENGRIQIFDLAGNYIDQFAIPSMNSFGLSQGGEIKFQPGAITISGNLIYVTNANLNTHDVSVVMIFDKSGNIVDQFGTSTGSEEPSDFLISELSSGIAVDENHIYVLDSGNNRVQVFDLSGNYVTQFGNKGAHETLIGSASDLAINSTHIFVADPGNSRVQIFIKDGPMDTDTVIDDSTDEAENTNDDSPIFFAPIVLSLLLFVIVKRLTRQSKKVV